MRADRRLRAMGTDVHLVAVHCPAAALDAAEARLHALEARWSRFRPDSEISGLARHTGYPQRVSPETAAVVAAAVDAWHRTGGRFDPTVGPALARAGYDRSFELIAAGAAAAGGDARSAPGCADVQVDLCTGLVWVPADVVLDVGGIAKGLAADWLVEDLLRAGAAGACVNIGGDLRAEGHAPGGAGWVVGVEHPGAGPVATVVLARGAAATSSTRRRRWRQRGTSCERHHVIDPATGDPSTGPFVHATVVAGTAAEAEVLSTVVLLAAAPEDAAAVLRAHGAWGLGATSSGEVHELGTPA